MSEVEASHEEISPEAHPDAGTLNGLLRLRRHLARIQAETHLLSADAQQAFEEIVKSLREALALDALGRDLPVTPATRAWPESRVLDVLWSGTDANAVEHLLEGLAGDSGWPRITLTTDLELAVHHLKRQPPDLWVVTLGSQDQLQVLERVVGEMDTPPVVAVLSRTLQGDVPQSFRKGGLEFVPERELTPGRLRELATRALVRRRFIQDLSDAQRRMEELVHRDALTGLHNRRYFESRLAIEFARATRFGEALTLVLLDVDHFKSVNDTHGHPAGDQVLVQTGRLLTSAVRSIDLVARVGGEEFALLLPNTAEAGATGLVQRIIDRVRQHHFGLSQDAIHVTLSAGMATCPQQGCADLRVLYEHADRALYQAKRRGRNRLEMYRPEGG